MFKVLNRTTPLALPPQPLELLNIRGMFKVLSELFLPVVADIVTHTTDKIGVLVGGAGLVKVFFHLSEEGVFFHEVGETVKRDWCEPVLNMRQPRRLCEGNVSVLDL